MFKNAKICHFLNSMELFDNAVRGIDDDKHAKIHRFHHREAYSRLHIFRTNPCFM